MPETHRAAVLLGSNLGDREANLNAALAQIKNKCGRIIASSPIYTTEPWGLKEQPTFLNQVVLLETILEPLRLLNCLLDIELALGRVREQKWASRIIDLDILHMDNRVVVDPQLVIPHPFLQERRFSLVPLSDVDPQWVHPVLHKSISELILECPDKGEVFVFE